MDGIDLSRKDLYEQLANLNPYPKTAAPGVGMYSQVYRQLADTGADQVISLHINSDFSNLSNIARLAGDAAEKYSVTVVETGQLTLGLGFLAISAAEAAQKGKSLPEILNLIKEQERRTFVYAALNSLDYLRASGRAPGLVVRIANLLRIKPIIQLHRGELKMNSQERTYARSIDCLEKLTMKIGKLEKLAILHANALEQANILADRLKKYVSGSTSIWVTEITPVLGVHVGPGAVGIACVAAK